MFGFFGQIATTPIQCRQTPVTEKETEVATYDMALSPDRDQQLRYDSATMIMSMKASIESLEEKSSSITGKSINYGQLAAEEVPKSLYCLGIRLTVEWFRKPNLEKK